jgi:hypothetical protein
MKGISSRPLSRSKSFWAPVAASAREQDQSTAPAVRAAPLSSRLGMGGVAGDDLDSKQRLTVRAVAALLQRPLIR